MKVAIGNTIFMKSLRQLIAVANFYEIRGLQSHLKEHKEGGEQERCKCILLLT